MGPAPDLLYQNLWEVQEPAFSKLPPRFLGTTQFEELPFPETSGGGFGTTIKLLGLNWDCFFLPG